MQMQMHEPPIPRGRPFRFFDLPAELRREILEYIVIFPIGIRTHSLEEVSADAPEEPSPEGWEPFVEDLPMALTDLFLVCSQMFNEASAVFYGSNVFRADLGNRKVYRDLTRDGGLLSAERRDIRRRIGTLHMGLRRLSGDFETVIAPALTDMILCGSLRNLKVMIGVQDTGAHAALGYNTNPTPDQAAVSLARTSPFQALLRLLADPDLESIELSVGKIHWSIWCPYRECPVEPALPGFLDRRLGVPLFFCLAPGSGVWDEGFMPCNTAKK